MTVDEAKKILLSTPLKPPVREALNVLIPDLLDYYNLPGEQWYNVVGEAISFKDDYQISNLGRVRSFKCGKVTILKPHDFGGYLCVEFKKGDVEKNFKIHRLVAAALVPNPYGKPHVNHIDGNKHNNCAENLEWTTHSENVQHAYDTGLKRSGCDLSTAKLLPEQVREIRRDCIPFDRQLGFHSFAKKFNVSDNIIRLAYYGRTYKNVE